MQTVTIPEVTAANAAQIGPTIAQSIWGSIKGDKHKDRSDVLTKLMTEIRKARDSEKDTKKREVKTNEQVIEGALGKALGDLQQAKVNVGGLNVNMSQLFKMAANEDVPALQKLAEDFIKEHKIELRVEASSRGKDRQVLQRVGAPKKGSKAK